MTARSRAEKMAGIRFSMPDGFGGSFAVNFTQEGVILDHLDHLSGEVDATAGMMYDEITFITNEEIA